MSSVDNSGIGASRMAKGDAIVKVAKTAVMAMENFILSD